jgi:hypothetical protein
MDAPKGKPICSFRSLPRLCSSNSALVQAKSKEKPDRARPFFPSGLPQPAANPGGVLAPRGEEPRALLILKVPSHFPRRGIHASKGSGITYFPHRDRSVSSSHARSSAISARSDQSSSRRVSLDDLGCSANASAASANFAKSAARPTTCSPVLRTSFRCRVTRTSSPLLVLRLPLLCISFARGYPFTSAS